MRLPGFLDPGGESPHLFTSIRAFWRALISTFHTRLDLLTTELEEEALRTAHLVVSGFVAIIFLHGAFFFAMLWLLAAVWDTEYRLWVIGGIFLVYLIVALGAIFYGYRLVKNRPRFLGQTLDELKRDVEGFKPPEKTKDLS